VAGPDLVDVARGLVERALGAGARAADAVVAESDGLAVGVRLGEVEKLKRARQRRAGLRIFVGDSTAIVSTADLTPDGLAELAGIACQLARSTAPDPHAGLPDPDDLAALSQAMRRLLDRNLRARMSDACRRLRHRLSFQHHVDRLLQIYQSCRVESDNRG